jgi:K(+)-stimulated pyrophosphate-energized sodium pump
MYTLWMIVGCGVLAILYGSWATGSVPNADPGSARMQEISAAVREGAQAYLKRRHSTIAIVGVVIFVIIGLTLGWLVAVGFAIGAILSGATGFIGLNVSVRAMCGSQVATKSLAGGVAPSIAVRKCGWHGPGVECRSETKNYERGYR